MGLLDDARNATQRSGPQCKLATLLDKCKPALREEFVSALKAPDISDRALASVLPPELEGITPGMLSHHRRNECEACKKAGRIW